ncbi:hypothetical protein [Priestia endophytica]|uniref:hypothetical protein n=1 Tax=Priestia endophytica TaxID=135735 RepID=UPI000DCA3308|nr:hypothetical protein [Priestia endophytica]RAS75715.1 hypothetical protein A4R27_21950 [Priestia endophytica]
MNIKREIDDIAFKVQKSRSFSNVFLKSPFLNSKKKQNKKWWIFGRGIIFSLLYLIIGTELHVFRIIKDSVQFILGKTDVHSPFNLYLASIVIALIPIIIICVHALKCFVKLVDSSYRGMGDVLYDISYNTLEKCIKEKKLSLDEIENQIVPYLESVISSKESSSIQSFLKVIIPSAMVAIPVSLFSVTLSAIANTSKYTNHYGGIFINIGFIGFMSTFIGGALYKALPIIYFWSETKRYKDTEPLFYGYLLAKSRGNRKKYKTSKRRTYRM